MKKLLLSVCLLATSLVASAQFTPTFTDAWSGFRFSYSPTTLDFDYSDMDDWKFKGFSFEYVKGFGIVEEHPIFLEVGAGLEWMNYRDSEETELDFNGKEYDYKMKWGVNVISLNIPINIGYKFSLQDNITIMPYVGLKARMNLLAKQFNKVKADELFDAIEDNYEDQWGKDWEDEYERYTGEDYEDPRKRESESLFDEKVMEKQTLKRFLLGWQIGATATYNEYSFGISYGSCFTDEIINNIDDCKFGGATISIGYRF